MANETNTAKSNSKSDKDGSTGEVKEATSIGTSSTAKEEPKESAAKEAAKPAATKEENKPVAKDSAKTNQSKPDAKPAAAVVKEEAKPVVKEEAKPPVVTSAAKEEPKAAAATAPKEEPKAAAATAPKEEPKAAAATAPKEEPKAAAATAPKEEPKPAPAATAPKVEPKPAAQEAPKAAPAPEAPRPAAPKPPPTVDTVSRVGRAEAIVRRNVLWSLGAGVVPFPMFDAVAITGVQLKMLAELSELYKLAFTESIAKKILGSLLSSIGGVAIGTVIGSSLVKLVPGVGTALGIMSVPVIGGAATHATGKVFIMHFEAGGTLLDFDPHKMRSHFKQEFEKSRQAVADMHKAEQSKTNKVS
jgi:uncharacterized protein (DUF697 family)